MEIRRVCKKCGGEKPIKHFHKNKESKGGRLPVCRACRSLASRTSGKKKETELKWRQRNRGAVRGYKEKWKVKNRKQYLAHKSLYEAIQRGSVIRQPCSVCGTEENLEGHHEDYDKQLEVIWLCRCHHNQLHRELNEADDERAS